MFTWKTRADYVAHLIDETSCAWCFQFYPCTSGGKIHYNYLRSRQILDNHITVELISPSWELAHIPSNGDRQPALSAEPGLTDNTGLAGKSCMAFRLVSGQEPPGNSSGLPPPRSWIMACFSCWYAFYWLTRRHDELSSGSLTQIPPQKTMSCVALICARPILLFREAEAVSIRTSLVESRYENWQELWNHPPFSPSRESESAHGSLPTWHDSADGGFLRPPTLFLAHERSAFWVTRIPPYILILHEVKDNRHAFFNHVDIDRTCK